MIETEEMTNIIYDTLMQNKQHPQLNLNDVEDCAVEVTAEEGGIWFSYYDRERRLHNVHITVKVSDD